MANNYTHYQFYFRKDRPFSKIDLPQPGFATESPGSLDCRFCPDIAVASYFPPGSAGEFGIAAAIIGSIAA
jgi:hypothetical protein